jgi:hypothetical protein
VKLKPVSIAWVFVAWSVGMLYGAFVGSTAAVRHLEPEMASLRGQVTTGIAATRALQTHLDAVTKDRDALRRTVLLCAEAQERASKSRARHVTRITHRRLFDNSLIAR